jgi:predicted glutamine amidotransferase
MQFILSKRTQSKKDTPLLHNPRDDGPHNDGVGIAHLLKNENPKYNEYWKIQKWTDVSNQPIYQNIDELQKSNIIIIHLRHKCHLGLKCKISTSESLLENTHPFSYRNIVFTHNGSIYDFHQYKTYLRMYIADVLFQYIKGDTDSEWLFYIILTRYYLLENKCPRKFHKMLEEILIDLQLICPEFTMNIIFSTPEFSVMTRYIYYKKNRYTKKQYANSLYYDTSNGFMVTSEPMTKNYKLVPENTAIYVDHLSKESFLQSILS